METRTWYGVFWHEVRKKPVGEQAGPGVFCYRREPAAVGELLRELSEGVMRTMEPEHDVLLVVGTRSRAEDFPDGFFKPYVWHRDFRQFRPL